ncbi:MAG: tRNA pseudouridine(38-40) synthase TruA [Candidatus Latescibacterota bacterium]|nr:MAG: tRNA pseudouridine(38-40) synthase TruA [Candidatus Latescibacterota bacterium]
MRNLKLTLEYDGTNFSGWQVQKEGRTVQGVLEEVLGRLLGERIRVVGAGRTDAGVHALGQVANFRTENPMPTERIERALDGLLPDDLAVREVAEVPPDFHARFSAKARRYRYNIYLRRRAVGRQYGWFVPYELDLRRMEKAAGAILGEHDFRAFCIASSAPKRPVCKVTEAGWSVGDGEVHFEVVADRFLHSMVRLLVGTMVEIGRGKLPVDAVEKALASGDRAFVGPSAPPCGLFLMEVMY